MNKDYYVELEGDVKTYFDEEAVIYPYNGRCLAVCRPKRFEEKLHRLEMIRKGERGNHIMRLIAMNAYCTIGECGHLLLREAQVRFMWTERKSEPDGFTFIKMEGGRGIDYIICVTNGDKDPVLYGKERYETGESGKVTGIIELMYKVKENPVEEE